jgi:hypothetical protein
MKWALSHSTSPCDAPATRGSYGVPIIQTSVSGGEVEPVCLELLPPHEQPISCMPDVTVRHRDELR